jgi:hypothetical protein
LSYRPAGDLACKRPVIAITVFFCKSSCLFYFIIFRVLVRRATSFSILNLAFFLGKRGEARGNGPADRGRRRRIASRNDIGLHFRLSPFFLNLVFEFNLLFEFSFFSVAARAQPSTVDVNEETARQTNINVGEQVQKVDNDKGLGRQINAN